MLRSWNALLVGMLAALGALMVAGAAQAQVTSEIRPGGEYQNYTSGSRLDRRPLVPTKALSPSPYVGLDRATLAEPIFMTSIHYPGIYGAYHFGTGGLGTLNREPLFRPAHNPRSDIPALTTTIAPIRKMRVVDEEPVPGVVQAAPPTRTEPLTRTTPEMRTAILHVHVPRYAELFFEGKPTAPIGADRDFETPPLAVGQKYRYDILARWRQNGRPIVEKRHVYVYAGDNLYVDFQKPAPETGPVLKTGKLPPPEPAPEATPPKIRTYEPSQQSPFPGPRLP
jgi:uncharacterized protein (TIGR03000 family)